MKNKKNYSNIIVTIVMAFLLLLSIGALAWVTKGFREWGINEKVADNENIVAVDENGNRLYNGGTYAMPNQLAFVQTIESEFEQSVKLTATIFPATANNPLVDWSAAWVNSSSTFASGKTVTEYVKISTETNGNTTATVSCLKAFGERIKIVCVSRDNPIATASCLVDYTRRIIGAEVAIYQSEMDYIDTEQMRELYISEYDEVTDEMLTAQSKFCFVGSGISSSYTIDDVFSPIVTLRGNPAMYAKFVSADILAPVMSVGVDPQNMDMLYNQGRLRIGKAALPILYDMSVSEYENLTPRFATACQIVRNNSDIPYMFLDFTFVGEYSTFTVTYEFYGGDNGFSIPVESLSLPDSDFSF